MKNKKLIEGVFSKRADDRSLVFYWKIDKTKSKDFVNQVDCAMDYITKYIEKNPKYQELVLDKTWDELFRMFRINIIRL